MDKTKSVKTKSKRQKCKCCNAPLLGQFHLIFNNADELKIPFLLFDFIGIKVVEKDGLDQAVCDLCLKKMKDSYEFKQNCLNQFNENTESETSDAEKDEEVLSEGNENLVEIPLNGNENIYEDEIIETQFIYKTENEIYDEEVYEVIEETTVTDELHVESDEHMHPVENLEKTDKDLLIDIFSLENIKKRISTGVPIHQLVLNPTTINEIKLSESEYLDDNDDNSSDNLINVLSGHRKRKRSNDDNDDNDDNDEVDQKMLVYNNIEYIDEDDLINLNAYLQSVVSISFKNIAKFSKSFTCMVCGEVDIKHFNKLIDHTTLKHVEDQKFRCVLDAMCGLFDGIDNLKNHLYIMHQNVIKPSLILTCQTCDQIFDSAVKFGKHMCLIDRLSEKTDGEDDYVCQICYKDQISKKRYLFHKQFHLYNARPKVCLICDLIFSDDRQFYDHVMFSHEQFFEYFCQHCDKSFSVESELKRHLYLHNVIRRFKCDECGKAFIDKLTLDGHSMVHQASKPFQCDICGKTYRRKNHLRIHLLSHDTGKVASLPVCEQCGQVFPNEDIVFKHYQKAHNVDYEDVLLTYKVLEKILCCEYCELAFEERERLLIHKKIHTDERPFQCNYCTAKYDKYSKLKTHKIVHGDIMDNFPIQQHYVCDVDKCLKTYQLWPNLVMHRRTVHLINPTIFKCDECGATFYQSWQFLRHKQSMHQSPFTCQYCGKTFSTFKSLKVHEKKIHENGKLISNIKSAEDLEKYLRTENDVICCIECNTNWPNRKDAYEHVRKHIKPKLLDCSYCDYKGKGKSLLERHMRTHTNERPYQCHHCQSAFTRLDTLKNHIKLHNGERVPEERRYQCSVCFSAFKRSYVLKNHMKRHTGVKDFRCPYESCGKEFRMNAAVNSHIKQCHQNIITESHRNRQRNKIAKRILKEIIVLPGPKEPPEHIVSTTDDIVIGDHSYPCKIHQIVTDADVHIPDLVIVLPGPVNSSKYNQIEEQEIISNGEQLSNFDDVHRPQIVYVIEKQATQADS